MTRPTRTQTGGPAFGIKSNGGSVGLEVNANLSVAAGYKGDGKAASLARVLGVLNDTAQPILQGKMQEMGAADAKQGEIDATLGQINPSKLQQEPAEGSVIKSIQDKLFGFRKENYTRAVTRTEAIKGFLGASRAVQEWAQTEGALLAPGEFEVELDNRMKAELDGFQNDPEAAGEIAKRYLPFINQMAGEHNEKAIVAQKQSALETSTTDVAGRLARGEDVDYGTEVEHLATSLGDRSLAVTALVGAHTQAALEAVASGDDPDAALAQANSILDRLKAPVTGDDGKALPGPADSTAHRAEVDKAREYVTKAHAKRIETRIAVEKFKIEAGFADRIEANDSIEMDELIPLGLAGVFSDQELLDWYTKGHKGSAKAAMKASRTAYILETNDRSVHALIDTIGPDGEKITRNDMDMALGEIVSGYPPEQQLGAAMSWSAKTGLTYLPLKNRLTAISTSDPKDLAALHDEYEMVKASGLVTDYTSPEAAAMYERYGEMKLAGMTDEAAIADLRRDPKEAEAYAKRFEKPLREEMDGIEVHGVAPGDDELLNSPYAQRVLNSYAQLGLRNGLSPEKAAAFAKDRFEQGHMSIETPKGVMLLPKVAGSSKESMQWAYDELLPKYAEEKGLDVEQLRFVPIGPNGEMILTDESGMRVTPEVFTPQRIGEAYRKQSRESAYTALKNESERERIRKTDPEGFKRLERQAAFERGRKRDADLRKYTESRHAKTNGSLPLSSYQWENASNPGGRRGRAATQQNAQEATMNLHADLPSAVLEKSPSKLLDITVAEAEAQGVATDLARGIAQMESSGGKNLRNPKSSARGPMHILKATFDDVNDKQFGGKLNWDDVRDQTKASVGYLAAQTKRFKGDPELAVLAYFLGPQGVQDLISEHGSKEAMLDVKIKNNVTPRQYLTTVRKYANI